MATKAQLKALRKARKKLKPAPDKYMRKSGKTKGKAIATSVRKRTATIVQTFKGKTKIRKRYRFPIPDKAHARNALARINQAKDLSRDDKLRVIRKALQVLGRKESAEEWAKKHNV